MNLCKEEIESKHLLLTLLPNTSRPECKKNPTSGGLHKKYSTLVRLLAASRLGSLQNCSPVANISE